MNIAHLGPIDLYYWDDWHFGIERHRFCTVIHVGPLEARWFSEVAR
jgi:hypothetical protein